MSDKSWRAELPVAIRIGNLELTASDYSGKMEICEWGESSRWVIAHLARGGDSGLDVEFIGFRPLAETVCWDEFKRMLELAGEVNDSMMRVY